MLPLMFYRVQITRLLPVKTTSPHASLSPPDHTVLSGRYTQA